MEGNLINAIETQKNAEIQRLFDQVAMKDIQIAIKDE